MLTRRHTILGLGATVVSSFLPTVAFAKKGNQHSRQASAYGREVAQRWFELAVSLTKTTTGFTPPVASRAFGYLGFTLYQSVVGGMPGYPDLSKRVNGRPHIHRVERRRKDHPIWSGVANAALAEISRGMYGDRTSEAKSNIDAIDQLERELNRAIGASRRDQREAAKLGRKVAKGVFRYSKTDGGHRGYLSNFPASYVPPEGPGLWVPTPPMYLSALQPYWGSNRTFSLSNVSAVDPGPPPEFSLEPTSAFYAELEQVYTTVNALDDNPEWLTIAQFWSDDPGETATPPGHSISIATILLDQTDANLAVAAEVYAKVGMAVADAFVAGWYTKYTYNLVRPITLVRQVFEGGEDWPLPLETPPFPEYISGHSVQSGAAAGVLTDVFGAVGFEDSTHIDRGFAPRYFPSFDAFAQEAAISRLYGGIHFLSAINNGVSQGYMVADAVLDLFR